MERKATPATTSASKNKSGRKPKKAVSTSRRNISEKWYTEHKVDFGNVANFYQITKEVSRGAYGVVYEGFLLNPETKQPTTRKVAVKVFYQTLYPQLILMELFFLKLVKDTPNMVRLENVFLEKNQFFIVTEFYDNIHFEKIIWPPRTFSAPMSDIKCYMYALLEGLASLHELGVVHRDIKQGNFLYNAETKKGILIDFGLAEISSEMRRKIHKDKEENPKKELYEKIGQLQGQVGDNKIGTEGFMPPEQVLKKSEQSYAVDIWSAGMILLEFLTSKHTLLKNLRHKREKGENQMPVEYAMGFVCTLGKIFGTKKVGKICEECDVEVTWPEKIQEDQVSWTAIVKHAEFDADCEDLLDRLLKLKPSERISAKDALFHPFFGDLRRPNMRASMVKNC